MLLEEIVESKNNILVILNNKIDIAEKELLLLKELKSECEQNLILQKTINQMTLLNSKIIYSQYEES